jgi:hypothetical protein
MFEPQVAAHILDSMSFPLKNLKIYRNSSLEALSGPDGGWKASVKMEGRRIGIRAKIIIDATELGDVLALNGIPYDIGMDSRKETGEEIAPPVSNDIIQDLTYVAILKDYGSGVDKTINKPENYDPSGFRCTCAGYCNPDSIKRTLWACGEMMNYGKLPNGYYMINWPIFGNDYYANVIDMDHHEREAQLQKAKHHTLSYVYYLQNELGFRNLGLAEDVFPTHDQLPLIPYYRESRRMKGLIRFTLNDLAKPYAQDNPLYRTGIAVGDYPVDHHHEAYPDHDHLPDLHFYPVPSYTVPLGTLIPENSEFFIVAEKSISVTNLVNGTTRLQPVCMLIGQAAGILAALSVQESITPANVPVRKVQQALLQSGAYLLPFSDVRPDDPVFNSLQRIGATGILRGEGKNIGWENYTHIYPDSMLTRDALLIGLDGWLDTAKLDFPEGEAITMEYAMNIIMQIAFAYNQELQVVSGDSFDARLERVCQEAGLDLPDTNEHIDRKTFAFLLDRLVDPFTFRAVDHRGQFMD